MRPQSIKTYESHMTRIEELVLQRNAIDLEIEAEYKKEHEAAARARPMRNST